ncbi:MAG TPA: roadblock/LC7 domain-containing protein [bacterium]
MPLNFETLDGKIKKLKSTTKFIEGVSIASPDGLILISTYPDNTTKDRVGAMSSELLISNSKTSGELDCGNLMSSLILGTKGGIILHSINEEMVLVTKILPGAKVGVIFTETINTAKDIRKMEKG